MIRPTRPAYVPPTARYVPAADRMVAANPISWVTLVLALAVAAVLFGAALALAVGTPRRAPDGPVSTPTTYGPPPAAVAQ